MASLRDIKRRITSVRSTQKITRAMKMVAAAKLRRAQDAILRTRPYAYHMRALVNNVAGRAQGVTHTLLRAGGGGKVGVVMITSDRGLCGGFNANIVNNAIRALDGELAGREVAFTVVGRKGVDALRRRKVPIATTHPGHAADIPELAITIIDTLIEEYGRGEMDAVYCLYNEFKSAVQQRVVLERLLPFELDAESQRGTLDYLYEPSQEAVLEALLVQSMHVQMHRILYESAASEFGARMTAMDAATRNAGDVIGTLTLQYNRARQDAITTELIEVISGAEAL